MSAGIGHNGGPALSGQGWRRHAWRRARRDLLPHMPLAVVRRRVARARELGLDYRVYASVRATTGRDIVGFLFSQNALRPEGRPPAMPDALARRVAAVTRCLRLGLTDGPAAAPLDAVHPPPPPWASYAATRAAIDAARQAHGLPADGVLLIGAAPWEPAWCAAGRLAGYLDAERYFGG